MNIATQIQAAAASSSKTTAPDRHPRLKNLLLGGKAQSTKALDRYRKVMAGRGWMTQRQIENALGYAATVSTAYLAKLLEQGIVERRNRGGVPVFAKRLGYEWRWKA